MKEIDRDRVFAICEWVCVIKQGVVQAMAHNNEGDNRKTPTMTARIRMSDGS